jgi:hypothetical protein
MTSLKRTLRIPISLVEELVNGKYTHSWLRGRKQLPIRSNARRALQPLLRGKTSSVFAELHQFSRTAGIDFDGFLQVSESG